MTDRGKIKNAHRIIAQEFDVVKKVTENFALFTDADRDSSIRGREQTLHRILRVTLVLPLVFCLPAANYQNLCLDRLDKIRIRRVR